MMAKKTGLKNTKKKNVKQSLSNVSEKIEANKEDAKTVNSKEKKVYQVSPFFYALLWVIVLFFCLEVIFLGVLYFNYRVYLEPKNTAFTRVMRAHGEPNRVMTSRSKIHRDRKAVGVKKLPGQKKKSVPVLADAKVEIKTSQVKSAINKAEHPVLKCPEPVARRVSFNPEEYAPYAGEGNAVIEGSACFELADGSEKCFENVDVFINPVTSYSDEWYERGWAGREVLQKPDERAMAFNKMVKTDKKGTFKFLKLKPGSYYVGTSVCLPENKNSKICRTTRFASKVKMKNLVKATLKKVYP